MSLTKGGKDNKIMIIHKWEPDDLQAYCTMLPWSLSRPFSSVRHSQDSQTEVLTKVNFNEKGQALFQR